ncbi:hypothetical protein B0H14DRAFT_2825580 [Mycena olivaceomarginata]|nr:hypothetical protein B0H14DRAFT_2825580 [Mycena olivaceomarginata]
MGTRDEMIHAAPRDPQLVPGRGGDARLIQLAASSTKNGSAPVRTSLSSREVVLGAARAARSSLVPRVLNKVQRECGDGDEVVRHGVRDHIDIDAERCRGFGGDSDLEGYAKTTDGARGILSRASTRTHRCREFRGNAVARAVRAELPLHHRYVLLLKLSFIVHAHRCRCVLHWSPQVALCGGWPCGMLVGYGMREGGSCVVS